MTKTKVYTLRTDSSQWLGQIVLTQDGMFASVTDWGNFSYAWRSTGEQDFRKFFIDMNTDYFAGKMYLSINIFARNTTSVKEYLMRFAEKILPALQAAIKQDLIDKPDWD